MRLTKVFFGFQVVCGGQPWFWGALIAFQQGVSQHLSAYQGSGEQHQPTPSKQGRYAKGLQSH